MANNVYSTIRFESGSIESEHEFLRVFSEIENKDERGLEYSDIYTFGPTHQTREKSASRLWICL